MGFMHAILTEVACVRFEICVYGFGCISFQNEFFGLDTTRGFIPWHLMIVPCTSPSADHIPSHLMIASNTSPSSSINNSFD